MDPAKVSLTFVTVRPKNQYEKVPLELLYYCAKFKVSFASSFFFVFNFGKTKKAKGWITG